MPLPAPYPAPERDQLSELQLDAVVRDYPETLAVFRRMDVDVPRRGGQPVAAALDGDTGPLLDALIAALSWRSPAP